MLRTFAISWLLTFAGHCADVSYGVFTPQVKSFVEAGKSVGVKVDLTNVTVHFMGELPRDWIGMCVMNSHDVFILEPVWIQLTDTEKEVLVWHELGHCALGRDHKENMYDKGHPVSLMYHSILAAKDPDYYYMHKKDYINELFRLD